MARTRKAEEVKKPSKDQTMDHLFSLIPVYGDKNAQCNALKKEVSDLNNKIKLDMIQLNYLNDGGHVVDGWKCSLTTSDVSTMNEDQLIEVAKKNNINIVRTKECIDFDALESLIYEGKIPQDVLLEIEACKEVTLRETLRVTKVKTEGE